VPVKEKIEKEFHGASVEKYGGLKDNKNDGVLMASDFDWR
jgi:hypothetical protein